MRCRDETVQCPDICLLHPVAPTLHKEMDLLNLLDVSRFAGRADSAAFSRLKDFAHHAERACESAHHAERACESTPGVANAIVAWIATTDVGRQAGFDGAEEVGQNQILAPCPGS